MPCGWPSISITSCCSPATAISAAWWPPCSRGQRVSVVSTLQTQPPMVADELRRQADQFIDLADLEEQICRDPATRADRGGRAIRPRPASRRDADYQDNDDLAEEV